MQNFYASFSWPRFLWTFRGCQCQHFSSVFCSEFPLGNRDRQKRRPRRRGQATTFVRILRTFRETFPQAQPSRLCIWVAAQTDRVRNTRLWTRSRRNRCLVYSNPQVIVQTLPRVSFAVCRACLLGKWHCRQYNLCEAFTFEWVRPLVHLLHMTVALHLHYP